MKLAILGTRGVPNFHGGFEQFAEYFSVYMASKGHEIYVYSPHNHPFKENKFKGVNIIHCYDPEHKVGTFGQFIYDLNCILDSRRKAFDIILQLGYTSSSVWGWLLPKKAFILTNMDGLEWKRSKYSPRVRKFLKYAEKWGVKYSDHLIADSLGIQEYLKLEYQKDSTYIPYGAEVFETPNPEILNSYELSPYAYNMLIARLEPENNIETILDGISMDPNKTCFLVVGKHETAYGEYLKDRYSASEHIKFLGGIYDIRALDNLRYYSQLYFHGHSVGGTNPSLLEAMASNALIIAHNNIFNRSILENDAFFFDTSEDVLRLLRNSKSEHQTWISNNISKIRSLYSWDLINRKYEKLMEDCLER
ncbi:DUF1972 domain-containing protein [Robiginitalea sp. M366]|uniref:DUF1972 domain-containing protein n=1 Tax=Robiginitalea aestuariiviva TaxID=3036903 RepID=UPI00240D8DBD|nr:DUF1972 domain-containing protein [Robiginitalea aestuariiviva]MDG1571469.1 DUF1972 domain-containing protein [Robiginitalea aestuariiviva]